MIEKLYFIDPKYLFYDNKIINFSDHVEKLKELEEMIIKTEIDDRVLIPCDIMDKLQSFNTINFNTIGQKYRDLYQKLIKFITKYRFQYVFYEDNKINCSSYSSNFNYIRD